MNLATMRSALSDPGDQFPEDALAWARDNAAQATPALLALLTACAKTGDLRDREAIGAFYALPALASLREVRAFPLVCALARNGDRIDDIYADFGVEYLPRLLLGIYGGDATQLLDVAGDTSVDTTVRASFLRAWCWHVLQGNDDKTVAREILDRLRPTIPANGGFLRFEWMQALLACDPDAAAVHLDQIAKTNDETMPQEAIAELEGDLAAWREDFAGQRETYLVENGPMGDPIGHLRQWLEREDEAMPDSEEDGANEAPVQNEFRDVGRNDPCPCGSGKKFKKCCLPP